MPTLRERWRARGRAGVRSSFSEAFGFGSFSFLIGGILGVATSIAIARLYGIDVIGEFALASAPTGLVWFLSTVRERPALIRALSQLEPRHDRVTGLFAAVFAFSFGLTTVVAAIAAGATYFLFNGPIDHPDLFVPAVFNLLVYLVFVNTCWNLDGVFSSFLAGRQLFWIRTQQGACYLLFAAVGALALSADLWVLIGALTLSWATSLAYRLVLVPQWMKLWVPRREIREGFRVLPEILKFGLKITPGSLADGVSAESGTWILGSIGSIADVGAWNRAWTLGKRLLDMNYRMSEMLFPTLVERHAAGDRVGFDRAFLDALRYVSMALLLPAAVGGGAAIGVMDLFGPGFSRASTALALTMLVTPMMSMIVLETQALLAMDRPLLASFFSVGRMLITIAASIPLTVALGVTGPALGVAVGCVCQLGAQLFYVRRYLSGPVSRFWPKRCMAIVVASYGAGFLASRAVYAELPGTLGLLVALGAGSLAYVGCCVLGGALLPRDRERIRRAAARVGIGRGSGGGPSIDSDQLRSV
jgi:O-antigen/teichoic acid export membrane protein